MDQETNDLWVWAIEAAAVQLSLRPNTQPQDGAVFCQLISLEPEEFEDAVSIIRTGTHQWWWVGVGGVRRDVWAVHYLILERWWHCLRFSCRLGWRFRSCSLLAASWG